MEQEQLCVTIQDKLQRWASLGEAPEYYNLKNRGPHKPTITHPLNRFGGNMGPYADALLPLTSVEYINASPIDNLGQGAMPFVATMCPKRETFAHFWSMVWELESRVIINLTHERDRVGSGPSDKRERYWPPLDDLPERHMSKWPVRPYTLGTESCEQVPSLLRYTIELRGPAEAHDGSSGKPERPRRIVYLYWYSKWVDFPSSSSIGSRPFYANAWAVLHIGLHIAAELDELGSLRDESGLDAAVTHTIEAMREKRLWMVKTDIEYATLYAALLLRLRNPEDTDFALTWPLKDGRREPLLETSAAGAAAASVDAAQQRTSPAVKSGRASEEEESALAAPKEGGVPLRPAKRATPASSASQPHTGAAAPPDSDSAPDDTSAALSGVGTEPSCPGVPSLAGTAAAANTIASAAAGGPMSVAQATGGSRWTNGEEGPPSEGDAMVSEAAQDSNDADASREGVDADPPSVSVGAGGGGAGAMVLSPTSPGGLVVTTPEDEEMDDPPTDMDADIDNAADVANYAGVGQTASAEAAASDHASEGDAET